MYENERDAVRGDVGICFACSEVTPYLIRPWLSTSPARDSLHISEFMSKDHDPQYLKFYAKQTVIAHVFGSIRDETGIPKGSFAETMSILNKLFHDEELSDELESTVWPDEGVNGCPTRIQMARHLQAVRYLYDRDVDRPLMIEEVIETYALMMKNAVSEGGKPLVTDRVRMLPENEEVYSQGAGGPHHSFPPACSVRSSTINSLAKYESRRKSAKSLDDKVSVATGLFYDLITIQPFMNGNGRLCRLILAFALRREGFPFFVTLSTNRTRSRKHYLRALFNERKETDDRNNEISAMERLTELRTLVIFSMKSVVDNYVTNARVMNIT